MRVAAVSASSQYGLMCQQVCYLLQPHTQLLKEQLAQVRELLLLLLFLLGIA
jgi:hypothetical protein